MRNRQRQAMAGSTPDTILKDRTYNMGGSAVLAEEPACSFKTTNYISIPRRRQP
jgi:hypothetical protein